MVILNAPGTTRAAGAAFAAIPAETKALYTIDLARYYFSGPEAERADRVKLNGLYDALERFKGKLLQSPEILEEALGLYERATIAYTRHENYLFLRAALNTGDQASRNANKSLGAAYESRTAFVRQDLGQIDSVAWNRFVKRRPQLNRYAFAVKSARRALDHQRPLAQEALLLKQLPATTGWQYDLYETLIGRTDFGTVETAGGPLDVLRGRRVIANDPDAAVRRTGFEKLYGGFAANRDLYAFILRNLVRARNQLARLHGFEDDAESSYFNSYWNKTEVTGVLAALAGNAGIYKAYQRERARRAGKLYQIENVNVWDVSGGLVKAQAPKFTITKASKAIVDATAPLGQSFSHEMSALLDPHNGRLDIVPGAYRKSGGFSLGFIGVQSVFFTDGYRGEYDDMRVLAHEATHAVHRQLMTDNGVSSLYASGPSYLFESFAAFSELLLADHLYETATDPVDKQYFLGQFLQGKATVMFIAGPEAMLEQAVYEAEAAGKPIDADTLDAMTIEIYSRYSIWPEKNKELQGRWMMIPLMYEDPFYDLNYVYAGLLALVYYDSYRRDPKSFAKKYQALMENGFDAEPDKLLHRTLGLDIRNTKALVAHAMEVLQEKVEQYGG